MKLPPYILVFDVESLGLFGEGFAVGGVVIATSLNAKKKTPGLQDSFVYACRSAGVAGDPADRAWVERYVKLEDKDITAAGPAEVRAQFWDKWSYWKAQGAWLAADVPWPVEARFLLDCCSVADRRKDVPYPLLDIAAFLLASGKDPLASYPRLRNEKPVHHPLADAQQSARLLYEAILHLRKYENVTPLVLPSAPASVVDEAAEINDGNV